MLLALDGLHPPWLGACVSFEGGKPKVTDGPFPASNNETIEVRQVHEMADFVPEVQKAAEGFECPQAAAKETTGASLRRSAPAARSRCRCGRLSGSRRWGPESVLRRGDARLRRYGQDDRQGFEAGLANLKVAAEK